MSAAVHAVLETAELLEFILLNLDTRTLLLAQRVDKRWHYAIRGSKPLQQKLFLLPTNTFDQILNLGLLDPSRSEKYNILDATSNRSKWLEQVVILNDLLFDTTREWRLRTCAFADPARRSGKFIPSWQRMLLTQPPPSTGRGDVMFWFEDAHDNDELCEDVNTMGDMMNKVYVKEAGLTGFRVHWSSASVRPVKHAVDGRYYMKLRSQREKDVNVSSSSSTAAAIAGPSSVIDFAADGRRQMVQMTTEPNGERVRGILTTAEVARHRGNRSSPAARTRITSNTTVPRPLQAPRQEIEEIGWPSSEGAEFANL